MVARKISISQCAAFSGLAAKELVLGVAPSAKHDQLYSSYLLNLGSGHEAVLDMIVADIRGYIDLGAMGPAADLLIVLRRFLSELPDAARPQKHAPAKAGSGRSLRRKKNHRRSRATSGLGPSTSHTRGAGSVVLKDNVFSLREYRQRRGSATLT